jgi:hypothetical protein
MGVEARWITLPTAATPARRWVLRPRHSDSDCTSGVCRSAYLMWNGTSAYLINSVDATESPMATWAFPPATSPPFAHLAYRRTTGAAPNIRQLRFQLHLLPITNDTKPYPMSLSGRWFAIHPWNSIPSGAGTEPLRTVQVVLRRGPGCACSAISTPSTTRPAAAAGAMGWRDYSASNARVPQLSRA